MNVVKQPHTALFIAPTDVGKTYTMLNLLETEYRGCFEYIIILCPTLKWNKTYHERSWIWKEDSVFLIDPKERLMDWIEKLSLHLAGAETLFILDDCIADETLDKKRQSLLELATSGGIDCIPFGF